MAKTSKDVTSLDYMHDLRKSYASQLESKANEIAALWRDVEKQSSECTPLKNLVHMLAGSAGTYGFKKVGQTAKKLELALENFEHKQNKKNNSVDQKKKIRKMVHELQNAAKNTQLFIPIKLRKNMFNRSSSSKGAEDDSFEFDQPLSEHKVLSQKIILLQPESQDSQDLIRKLAAYGYHVVHLTKNLETKNLDESDLQVQNLDNVSAVLVDLDQFVDEKGHSVDVPLDRLQQLFQDVPLLFMSSFEGIAHRLKAVRAGGTAYFTKPLDVGTVVDRLDNFSQSTQTDPYRVLIVDDEPFTAHFHELILQKANMVTKTVNNPWDVLHVLHDFKPDIVLMDLYMPDCDGWELASVIRQQDAFVGLPIVFLSAETRHAKQASAMQLGGDEFLTKPIKPKHLIESVSVRVERLRKLRSFMTRDSLTGLLNHSTLQDSLSSMVAQAQRNPSFQICFALLDIDFFKAINDQYGHMVGDRVLKNLSRYLKQRLRKTDIIGRYGGEEFGIVFINTPIEAACKVLDDIRIGFSKIQHVTDVKGKTIQVTFSAGVSDFDKRATSQSMTKSADEALYHAKKLGKNRVVAK